MNVASFFVTVGPGLEQFAAEVLTCNLNAHIDHVGEGNVRFLCEARPLDWSGAKCCERIFLEIFHVSDPPWNGKTAFNLFEALKFIFDCINEVKAKFPELIERALSMKFGHSLDEEVSSENEEVSEPKAKRRRFIQGTEEGPEKKIGFRVNCKCRGKMGRRIDCSKLSKQIASRLLSIPSLSSKCAVDLMNPDLEFILHLNDQRVNFGIPLTSRTLADRDYILHPGLRSTVCDALLMAAALKTGDVVLDPFCGFATILTEACVSQPETALPFLIGSDSRFGAILKGKENVDFLTGKRQSGKELSGANCQLVGAIIESLPFAPNIFDCIVTDAPFGQKHGDLDELINKYPRWIRILSEVLKVGGRMVILTSSALSHTLESAARANSLCLTRKHELGLGFTKSCLYGFLKREPNGLEMGLGGERDQ